MNKKIHTRLCTLLLGAGLLVSSASINNNDIVNTTNNASKTISTNTKNNLELIAQQGLYISPDRNYSLAHNPSDFGFVLDNQDIKSGNGYRDTYSNEIGWNMIEYEESKGELSKLYDAYSTSYIQSVSNMIMNEIKSGESIRIVGKGAPKHITVDNKQALMGCTELWISPAVVTDFVSKRNEVYTQRYTLRLTLAKGKNNIYKFSLFYYQAGKSQEAQANSFYDDVLKSFRASPVLK